MDSVENVTPPIDLVGEAYPNSNSKFRSILRQIISGLDLTKPNNQNADYLNRQIKQAVKQAYLKKDFVTFIEENDNHDGYYLISIIDKGL